MQYLIRYTLDDGKTGCFNVNSYKFSDARTIANSILAIRHPKQQATKIVAELSQVELARLQQEPDQGLDITGDEW